MKTRNSFCLYLSVTGFPFLMALSSKGSLASVKADLAYLLGDIFRFGKKGGIL